MTAPSAWTARGAPQLGIRLAGEPPHLVQSRLSGSRWQIPERAQEVGVVGWIKVDRFGRSRLSADQGAGHARATRGRRPGGALWGDPFMLKADGKGWLFVPTGLVDGPLPTHYEPAESPVQNPLYPRQTNPVRKY